MTYILLIVIVLNSGTTSTAIDGFASYEACVNAANQIHKITQLGTRVYTLCMSKNGAQP